MSSTMTTRRSRSGRQVRTTTSARRAVARQSIERTSSPTTYSRSESNSVPCPRISTGIMPSSSRSLASRDGRCLRDRNGGRIRICHGTRCERCRPASPSGPTERAVTNADCWSPRRTGRSRVSTLNLLARGDIHADGCAARRARWAARRRGPGRGTAGGRRSRSISTAATGWPSRAAVSPDRVNRSRRVWPPARRRPRPRPHKQCQQHDERRCRPGRQRDRQHADQRDQAGAAGEDH